MKSACDTAEWVTRAAYGRLIAILSARSRDIAAAEDALAEAFAAALRSWSDHGVPTNPEAWLLTAARNVMKNQLRHRGIVEAAVPDLLASQGGTAEDGPTFPDERLKLLFACAHPAIDASIRTPLMLQTILGLDAARIGRAFLVAPTTMGQRLTRAKAKIRDSGLRFELPSQHDMPQRLSEVLDAIYAAFGIGWDATDAVEAAGRGLTEEAIYLGRLMAALMPEEPEVMGLLALMLYCDARRDARRDERGTFVPLDRQDARLWKRDMIIEAEGLLTAASRHARFGRFQCEAAIQSVHVQRPITGRTNHEALVMLYRLLVQHHPSMGAKTGLAAVLIEAGRANEALGLLDDLAAAATLTYQPYWATRGKALHALGQMKLGDKAIETAIGLTEEKSVRVFLGTLISSRAT
jgi:RNA polymerase sigma-70 factor (ECF subfamily)